MNHDILIRYYTELRLYALHLSRNRTDAEDLVQETFYKAFRAWKPEAPWENPKAWLYRAMYNTFVSHVRKHSGHYAPFDLLEDEEYWDFTRQDPDLEDGILGRELIAKVAAFVDALPAKQRRAWLLRHQRGFEFDMVAEEMGTTIQAARSSVHQVTLKLRATFEVPWR